MSAEPFGTRTGRITAFDDKRGVGEVTGDDGHVFAFHCTVIADGSRMIPVGTAVVFSVIAGHLGRWEAVRIAPRQP